MTDTTPGGARGKPTRFIPIAVEGRTPARALQRRRLLFQVGFFVLFILAPVFDLFRYDLDAGHLRMIAAGRAVAAQLLGATH